MTTLPKTYSLLHYNDESYKYAVNYQQSLYNYPITLNYGGKHNRAKYILSAGTSDHITVLQDGIFIYVLSENSGLSYISLQVFNTETRQEEGNVFLNESDCTTEDCYSYGILDMDTDQQLKILSEYIN